MATLGTSDLDVFPLSLGGNVFGWTADRDASFAILDAYTAAGGDFLDTADAYSAWIPGNSGGESETIIGEWLAARGNRDAIVVATKVSQHPDFRGLSAKNIAAAARASLQRLGVDRIDLYYAHYDDPETPLAESVEAFDQLVKDGIVRYTALSNFTPQRVDEWLDIAEAGGYAKPVALQPHYNLVHRRTVEGGDPSLLTVAEDAGLGLVPYYALASGFLTGKYSGDAKVDSPRAGGASKYDTEQGQAIVAVLREIAAAHDASVTTTALAWLLARPTVVAPIASASRVEQVADLVAVADLTLGADEIARLDEVSAGDPTA